MAQLSRPFQIAVLALAVLALASFVVLHRAGGTSKSSSSPSVASSSGSSGGGSSSGSSSGSSGASSSPVYHGSAPGLEGLTRAVAKAHEAVAETGHVAQETQSKAEQTSSGTSAGTVAVHETPSGGTAPRSTVKPAVAAAPRAAVKPAAALHPTTAVHPRQATAAPTHTSHAHSGTAAASQAGKAPAMQAKVTAELKQGKVVLLLFWNPRSVDDVVVAIGAKVAAHRLGHRVALHLARVSQIDSFGSITRAIQLYQTPTLLIVNPKLQVTQLTGFIDAASIEQAVFEARK